jgi:hypothetical protein
MVFASVITFSIGVVVGLFGGAAIGMGLLIYAVFVRV